MKSEFQAIEARANAIRMTETEVVLSAGIGKVRWWRAKTGVTKPNGATKLLRFVEAHLAKLEAERAPICSLCQRPGKADCLTFGCPFQKEG